MGACNNNSPADHVGGVQEYYGKTLSCSSDLRTSACTAAKPSDKLVARALENVSEEVKNRFYGCGSPIPPCLDGVKVLDAGCGSGRDCFVLSQLVGREGRVVGVDTTEEQAAIAKANLSWHAEKFGVANVDIETGRIEDLAGVGIEDNSMDLVISNCVLNLSDNKPQAIGEIFRVLKPGGELYFSDVFSDRPIPAEYSQDPVMVGECLAGAWNWEAFGAMLASVGCMDYRVVSNTPISLNDAEMERKIGAFSFQSCTVRAFKLSLEKSAEDYGQTATYGGGIEGYADTFTLDNRSVFQRGTPIPVSGNTAKILNATRYAPHFTVKGDASVHRGPFVGRKDADPSTQQPPTAKCC
ncbi:hypothetical protein MBLNU230_g5265t1 [Neophaeotheca triangularis]